MVAFTLIELLVVIGIIAALSVISLPAIRGLGQSNKVTSGTQQLIDDLMLARQKAMVGRTTVHVVFVSSAAALPDQSSSPALLERDRKLWKRLQLGIFTTYALYAERALGDQPGQRTGRYLTEWRSLPDGVFIAWYEYIQPGSQTPVDDRQFAATSLPFPSADSPIKLTLPTVSFDHNGSCFEYESDGRTKRYRDELIHMAQGSVMATRSPGGAIFTDWQEIPPWNSTNNYNRIRINALSGRARLERKEIVL